jgi:hypothetical protein
MKIFTQQFKLILLIIVATTIIGCKESSFELSEESRLPKWFTVPDGVTRNELSVTMDYYIGPDGRKAVFKLKDKNNRVLEKASGSQQGLHPMRLKSNPEGSTINYPLYEVITVDDKTDIIEHRKMEPVFYMTDDPAVWKELGVQQQEN